MRGVVAIDHLFSTNSYPNGENYTVHLSIALLDANDHAICLARIFLFGVFQFSNFVGHASERLANSNFEKFRHPNVNLQLMKILHYSWDLAIVGPLSQALILTLLLQDVLLLTLSLSFQNSLGFESLSPIP